MSKSNLNSLKLTFINQSEYFFMLLNKNEKTNKIFTSFYYNLSKHKPINKLTNKQINL